MERADVMCPQHLAGIRAVKMTRMYRPVHTSPMSIEKVPFFIGSGSSRLGDSQ